MDNQITHSSGYQGFQATAASMVSAKASGKTASFQDAVASIDFFSKPAFLSLVQSCVKSKGWLDLAMSDFIEWKLRHCFEGRVFILHLSFTICRQSVVLARDPEASNDTHWGGIVKQMAALSAKSPVSLLGQ